MILSHDISERRHQWRRELLRILDEPVEICFSDEIGFRLPAELGAFYSPSLGPRRSIVVNRDALPSEHSWAWLDGLLLHEAAHAATCDVRPSSAGLSEALRTMTEQTDWRQWPAHKGPKWAGHGPEFIRALIHLEHRLRNRKVWVRAEQAFQHEAYGLSSISEYRKALGDEPQRRDWIGLKDVLCRAVPAEFSKLWQRDTGAALIGSFERC